MEHLDISNILGLLNRRLFPKLEYNPCYPFYPLLPQDKESSE